MNEKPSSDAKRWTQVDRSVMAAVTASRGYGGTVPSQAHMSGRESGCRNGQTGRVTASNPACGAIVKEAPCGNGPSLVPSSSRDCRYSLGESDRGSLGEYLRRRNRPEPSSSRDNQQRHLAR